MSAWRPPTARLGRRALLLGALLAGVRIEALSSQEIHVYFVAPSGTATNDGSRGAPWDLGTALANSARRVQPGDTILLRAGTYSGDFRSLLRGTPARPVVVRRAPGERAIVDGRINAYGAYTVFWGIEIMQSQPLVTRKRAIDVRGPGHRLVNLVVHDAGSSGIGFWMEAVDAEVYGCIIYNNGIASSLDHGIYAINRDGRKSIADNVVFNNYAYGIHAYGARGQALKHLTIEGNVAFGNGSISAADRSKSNLIVGGDGIAAADVTIADNIFFYPAGVRTPNVRLGYDTSAANEDMRFDGNTVIGGDPVLQLLRWRDLSAERNVLAGNGTLVSIQEVPAARVSWSANTLLATHASAPMRVGRESLSPATWARELGVADSAPVSTLPDRAQITIRPNRYEPGRANVAVINWGGAQDVEADLSAVLRVGDRYELRSVQQLFGEPVVAGRYDGGVVRIPMRALSPPSPTGRPTSAPTPTGPFFDVFILQTVP